MRHAVLLALPILALAACGPPSLEKGDGSFDRAGFRALYAGQCADGMVRMNAPEATANQICGCLTDRLIAMSSDEELRTYHREDRVPPDKLQALMGQCQHLGPGGSRSSAGVPDEEPPPPDEPPPPPPSMADEPRPAVTVPGDGPAPGGGVAGVTGPVRARANLSSYFTADDYPAAALRGNQQGRTGFSIDIGPDGRVTNCRVTESSGAAALDQATCRIIRSRARYTPARTARGVAVAGRDAGSVTWRLPEG